MGSTSLRSPSAPLPPIPPAEEPEAVEMAEGLPLPALPGSAAPPAEAPQSQAPVQAPVEPQPERGSQKEGPGETSVQTGSGYEAGLAAYEGGDLEEAALLWKSMLQEEEKAYTIQVEVACQPETVRSDFLRFGRESGLFAVPLQLKGRSCFRVLLGSFPSQEQATAALKDIPIALRSGLTVRAVKNIF